MSSLPPAVLQWLGAHHFVANRTQLRDLGLSDRQISLLLASGVLERQHRSVYRLTGTTTDLYTDALAACLASPVAVVSHTSAARLFELRKVQDRRLHISVPTDDHLRLHPAVVHRTNVLDPVDIVSRPDGIRHTSAPRTVFDLAALLHPEDLESVIEQVLDRRLCTIPTLWAMGRRLRGPGRAGSTRFVEVLSSRPAWRRPAQSDLEVVLARALQDAGLPPAHTQWLVPLADGAVVAVDLGFPTVRWGIEVDHVTWHGGRIETQADKRRDRRLAVVGVRVDRVTDEDIRRRLPGTVGDLVAIYRRRLQETGQAPLRPPR